MDSADPPAPPHIVLLAGGIGTRFWPASRPDRPKQLLPFGEGGRPLLEDAVRRALALAPPEQVEVLATPPLLDAFRPLLPQLPAASFVAEPRRRGTAPVLAWAAHRIRARHGADAIMVSLHADHRITPTHRFVEALNRAIDTARNRHRLVTLGVRPDRPETGYGWIEPAPPGPDGGARQVLRFREKPDAPTARDFLSRGFLWNSGLFVWRVADLLDAMAACSPEVGPHLGLLDRSSPDAFFEAVTPVSVDVAVLERSPEVTVVEADFRWDDVGTWAALGRTASSDEDGNVLLPSGEASAGAGAAGNVVWAEDGPVHLLGVRDLVVVRSGGRVVVAPRDRAHEWKTFLRQLPTPPSDEESA